MLLFATVPTTAARIVHEGNDVSTVFPTDFVFLDGDSLTVTLVDSAGTATVKALTTDYTVSGGAGTLGSVTCTSFTPATNEFLVIERAEAYTQETDLLTADPFAAGTIETTFDKIVMMIQQLLDLSKRAILAPLTRDPDADPLTLPEPEDGQFLVGRSDLTGWDNIDAASAFGEIDPTILGLPVSVANGGTGQTNAAAMSKADYAVATGSANAYVVSVSPAPTALAAGLMVRFQANHTADGAPTLNVDSLGAKAIKDAHGATLANGGLQSGGVYEVTYDGTSWILTGHSRPYVSKLSAIREYTSNNTWSKPDNLDYIVVRAKGGGGGGGGTAATSSSQTAAAGGGGEGEEGVRRVAEANLSATETIVICAAGAGGTAGANAGSDGSTTQFGSLLTAAGGKGGAGGTAVGGTADRGTVAAGGRGGTGGAGGTFSYLTEGSPGRAGLTHTDESSGGSHNGSLCQLGDGGGKGGRLAAIGAGGAGRDFGAGGAGAAALVSTAAQAGGAGKKGRVIVEEYTLAYV